LGEFWDHQKAEVFEACVVDFEEYVNSSVFFECLCLCVWFLEERGEKRREEKRREEERRDGVQ
jgi:hypothetical protein